MRKELTQTTYDKYGNLCSTNVVGATCPTCGREVRVHNGNFVAHDTSSCTGSAMVWRNCANSGKAYAGL